MPGIEYYVAMTKRFTYSACRLIKKANLDPKEIDLVIMATATPDMPVASTGVYVASQIGASNAFAYDLQAGKISLELIKHQEFKDFIKSEKLFALMPCMHAEDRGNFLIHMKLLKIF